MAITKKQDATSLATATGLDLVERHIGELANQAQDLKDALTKIDDEHAANRTKIQAADNEYARVRKEEHAAHERLQEVWKAKDSIKTKQRNLLRKQQTLESDRSAKWERYKEKSAVVRELQLAVVHGLYGVKRSASTSSIEVASAKMTKIDGLSRSPSIMMSSTDEPRKLPAFKKSSQSSVTISEDSEYGVKAEGKSEIKPEVKDEVKKE